MDLMFVSVMAIFESIFSINHHSKFQGFGFTSALSVVMDFTDVESDQVGQFAKN